MSSTESESAPSSGLRDPTISEPTTPRSTVSASSPAVAEDATRSERFGTKAVSIPYGVEREGVVYYTVNVLTDDDEKWSCQKRFSAFERLHQVVVGLFGHKGFPPGADLPEKKMKFFTSHVTQHFIEERRCLLDSYLNKMLKVTDVVKSDVWMDFLSSDSLPEYQDPPPPPPAPLDDCEVTSVLIPQTRMMSDHVLYQVDVCNSKKRRTFSTWTVLKRFKQFYQLDAVLRTEFANNEEVLAALPASPQRQSRLLYSHMNLDFVEHRRVLLSNYLFRLLHIREVAQSPHFLEFLGVLI